MAVKRIFLALSTMMLASMACILTDIRDVVSTVDKAIDLVQEIEESGTWEYIGTGVQTISDAQGYRGTFELIEGQVNSTGDEIVEQTERVNWTVVTDSDGESEITVTRNDQSSVFMTQRAEGDTTNVSRLDTYRLRDDGSWECITGSTRDDEIYVSNVSQSFESYGALAAGIQVISVAEESGSETINGFETTRYRLVSKLDEALDILSELPAEDLKNDIAQLPEFYSDGTLYIDDETSALVRYDAKYANLDEGTGNQFTFELQELGPQPDVSLDPSQIATPCTNPTNNSQ